MKTENHFLIGSDQRDEWGVDSKLNPLPDGPIAPPLIDGPRSYWT